MGWGSCGTNPVTGDEMGYNHFGKCSHPDCDKEVDHGLANVCGDMHEGGEYGCGRYFCAAHLIFGRPEQLCEQCYAKCDAPDEDDDDEMECISEHDLGGEERRERDVQRLVARQRAQLDLAVQVAQSEPAEEEQEHRGRQAHHRTH